MPAVFLPHFRKCVCIKDCFEVFCEQPSDLMARAQTYSNYKSHNTINVLTFSNITFRTGFAGVVCFGYENEAF